MLTPETMLHAIACRIWGPSWAKGLHEFAGLNLRTCQRLQADAATGKPNRQASGALLALKAALEQAAAEID